MAETPLNDDSLRSYLASRDVPCPRCGYNLRGSQDSVCSECGETIELGVSRAASGRGWLLFLLLALGWVLLSGGMHTTRSALVARDEASSRSGVQVVFGGNVTIAGGVGQPIVINSRPLTTGNNITISGGGNQRVVTGRALTTTSAGGAGARTPLSVVSGPATAGGPATTTTFITRPAVGGAGFAWAQVRVDTWVSLGIAAAITLVAPAIMLLVVLKRRKIIQQGPGRPLVTAAVAVFTVYAAGQVLLFVRELVG